MSSAEEILKFDVTAGESLLTVDQALMQLGFTWRRCLIYAISCLTFLSMAMSESALEPIANRTDIEWDLGDTCSKYLPFTLFATLTFSALVIGPIVDHFGRRRAQLTLQAMTTIALVLIATSQNVYMLFGATVLLGAGAPILEVNQITITEAIEGRYRHPLLIFWICNWTIGVMTSSIFADFIFPDTSQWRYYAGACAGFLGVTFLLQFAFLPESPRYLLTQGRYDEAQAMFRKLAAPWPPWKRNDAPDLPLAIPVQVKSPPYTALLTRKLLAMTLTTWLSIMTVTGMYYTNLLSPQVGTAGLFYLSLTEFPANLVLLVVGLLLGRRAITVIFFTAITILFGLAAVLSFGTWFYYIARFLVITLYNHIWLFIPDLYYTRIRARGVNAASFWARPAAAILPLVQKSISNEVMNASLAVLTGVSGILCFFFIPDNIGKDLKDNPEDTSTTQPERLNIDLSFSNSNDLIIY